MNLSTDILDESCYGGKLKDHVCIKALIDYIYLKITEQSQ